MSGIYVMTPARAEAIARMTEINRNNAKASMRKIIELMCGGHPDKVIAHRLGIAVTTIKHKRSVFMKHHKIAGRTQLGVWAERQGWAPVNAERSARIAVQDAESIGADA